MAELTREPPPPLSARIINRLTPTQEAQQMQSTPPLDDDHPEAA
ncbi:hypothetical protein [Actinophytocola sp.]